ncbi:MAG: phosphoenolpyruvate--protein phosphotransferase [Methylacidiphilales bacterium]|nr:phosphoenolpyruvate--protein phosphotransferase [Candidatus Methylacidiphilales bacterium]
MSNLAPMPDESSESPKSTAEERYKGTPVSPGIVVGPLLFLYEDEHLVRKRRIRPEDVAGEITRFEAALLKTHQQIQAIRNQLASSIGEADASIFDAHILLLEDTSLIESVKEQLQSRLVNVEFAYEQVVRTFSRKMRELNDDYFRERAGDFIDVSRRVLRNLQGKVDAELRSLDTPSIVLAHDLAPSDTAGLDRKMVLGMVTEAGSRTSHTAIMARSLNMPAVVGLRGVLGKYEPGTEVLLDGYEGLLIINPSEQTKTDYGQREKQHHEVEVKLDALRETLAITVDQRRIIVSANIEVLEDLPLLKEHGAEGVGLLRTEYLFLNQDESPSEDQQVDMYVQMARASKPHHLIIRTLDIGGDKKRPHLGIEMEINPFLGYRGIRYSLGRPDLFRVQLRAICRASAEGNVRIMFPMVSDLGELKAARRILDEVREELRSQNVPQAEKIEVGVMIEVPSAALTADMLARHVDFFSVGSNDLIQYTLAIDRGNEKVAGLYQPAHPAVLRLLQTVVEAAHRNNIWIGVCGEMSADVVLIPALVGLGVDELSAGAASIPRIKRAIQAINYEEARQLVARCVLSESVEANQAELEQTARRLYPEIL